MQKRMLKDCRIGLFLGALLFALAGCADKKDGSASCMNQLNAEQYQSVAENTNCSNYERASGYPRNGRDELLQFHEKRSH